jgi:hypothetical protein
MSRAVSVHLCPTTRETAWWARCASPNLPGTVDEYPNWRLPLPVTLEELRDTRACGWWSTSSACVVAGRMANMSDENRAGGAADVLWTAWSSGERIAALPDEVRPRDDVEGFAVQLALGGYAGRSYGWKIAATTAAGQAHIGVSGPLPGSLFERFRHDPGDVLSSDGMHMRVVEAEFAFLVGADVATDAGPDEILAAVDGLHLAVEVPATDDQREVVAGGPGRERPVRAVVALEAAVHR